MRGRNADERGSILVLSVVGVILAVISTALAVDLGRLAQDKRTDQKVADLAALDASRNVAQACTLAQQSVFRNGMPSSTLNCSDADLANPSRDVMRGKLVSGVFTADTTGDAVQVKVHSAFKTVFPFVIGPSGLDVKAIGQRANEPEAAFSVGSTLASLDTQKSALDGVLGGMLGKTAAQMNLVSYDGLATGNVSLTALKGKLLALGAGYAFGTPDSVLTSDIKVKDLLTATSQVLADQGNTTAKAEVDRLIALNVASTLVFKLGNLVSLDSPTTDAALATNINVFQLISGAAEVANGSSFISVPGINVTLPANLATVTTSLSVIQPAQIARGKVGVKAKTSQVKLRLMVHLLASNVNLNIDYSAASANGTLSAITCSSSPPNIQVTPTTNGAAISLFSDLGLLGTLSANGTLAATPANGLHPAETFNYKSQFMPPVGTTPYSRHIGAASLGFSPTTNMTVTASNPLLGGATALVVQTALPLVFSGVNLLLPPLLEPVLKTLGLDLAAADLSALDIIPPPPACALAAGTPFLAK